MPMNFGSIINKGVRKRTWRDSDNNIDFLAFPMLWKKLPMTIGKAMIGKVHITILMPSMEYLSSSSSVVKREHVNLGIVSPMIQPIVNVINANNISSIMKHWSLLSSYNTKALSTIVSVPERQFSQHIIANLGKAIAVFPESSVFENDKAISLIINTGIPDRTKKNYIRKN